MGKKPFWSMFGWMGMKENKIVGPGVFSQSFQKYPQNSPPSLQGVGFFFFFFFKFFICFVCFCLDMLASFLPLYLFIFCSWTCSFLFSFFLFSFFQCSYVYFLINFGQFLFMFFYFFRKQFRVNFLCFFIFLLKYPSIHNLFRV